MLVGSIQLQERWNKVVRRKETMAPMLMIVGASVVIHCIARSRIVRSLKRHVALAALDRVPRVTFMVPVTCCPVVILVLQLHPTDSIDLLVDELLMTGRAVFRRLVHPLVEAIVLRGPRPDKEVASKGAKRVVRAPLPQIFLWLRNGVVGISPDVGLLNGVAGETRYALVVAELPGQICSEDVLCTGEQRDGIVAASAVAG